MNVYESIMKGLNEAVEYEKGEKTARSVRMTILPLQRYPQLRSRR